ncbi:transcription factor BHLH062-like [Typha latifolia]|uniref:transcription factor BHLH062-like n=1 Tax=Typha latifolia TaxID=4733 RepID=UPI003C2F6C9E
MVPENPSSMDNEANIFAEKPADGSLPNKKSLGKVPKKIHKAEREKLKRDQLNDLFVELSNLLEPERQNCGKASILGDTTRILRDLLAQVESLRKENAALLTESRYVTIEKDELKDDKTALQAEISGLQNELRLRMGYDPVWNNNPNLSTQTVPHQASIVHAVHQQQPTVIGQVYAAPPRELQLFPGAATTPESEPSSHVRRPHPRYPTPSATWPGQLIPSHPRTVQEERSSSTAGSSSEDGDSLN